MVVKVGTTHFSTQAALKRHARRLLRSVGMPKDQQFCTELVRHHPKCNFDIKKVHVAPHPYWGGNCLHVTGGRGVVTVKLEECVKLCFGKKMPSTEAAVMRTEIVPQVQAYKHAHAKDDSFICQSCAGSFPWQGIHVDHCGSREFVDLSTDWLASDRRLTWPAYHAAHAELQILCVDCNLRKPKRKRKRKRNYL
jgi:hypothetical protein